MHYPYRRKRNVIQPKRSEKEYGRLARDIDGLTVPTRFLKPTSIERLTEALRIDDENGGFCDIGTFCCLYMGYHEEVGGCCANGRTYVIPRIPGVVSRIDRCCERVGPRGRFVNLCPLHAPVIDRLIFDKTFRYVLQVHDVVSVAKYCALDDDCLTLLQTSSNVLQELLSRCGADHCSKQMEVSQEHAHEECSMEDQ